MEMSKRSSDRTDDAESEALIAPSPSPFDSSTERRELQQIAVPTAVPVNDAFQENVSPTATAAAVAVAAPITDAVLNSSTNATKEDEEKIYQYDGIIVKPEPDDGANTTSYLPAATAIPSAGSLIQQQHTTSGQLRAANFKGILSTEEETAGIARAHRGIDEIQRETDEAVRAGNIAALGKKGKKDEGLAVDHMIHHLNIKCSIDEKEKKEDDDVRLYGTTNADGKRGYETKEYDTKEYTSEYEYDTTEYKSIYE
jgi:hypothetical protein